MRGVADLRGAKLKDITVLNPVPPILYEDSRGFDANTIETATLHIPHGSMQAYKSAAVWKDFKNIVEGNGAAGMESLNTKNSVPDVAGCYDLNGRKLITLQKGVNIIRYCDGTVRKVIVK